MKDACVSVIIMNEDGLYLGVSRKYDHTIFGLVGGKVEVTDKNMIEAAIRETKEETGLDIFDIELVFETEWKERYNQTFKAKFKGNIHTDEPHVVKWVTKKELIDGPFGEYNEMLFEHMKNQNSLLS